MDAADRNHLEEEWLALTGRVLPEAAERLGWPLRDQRCFQRVLLDNACHGVWHEDAAADSPSHRHASDAVLMDAITLGRAAAGGRADIARLNRQSLRWRAAKAK